MEQDTRQEIRDDGDLRKYRIEIPNMADDDLGVYEFRLYGHYKRVCGANGGVCFESVRTTAAKCRMSVGQVVETREWLSANGWIVTAENPRTRTLSVVVVDRWGENFHRYKGLSKDDNEQPHKWNVSDHVRARKLHAQSDRCVYCGSSVETLDHWLPRSRGGTDAPENLVASCCVCNYAKRDMTGEEYLEVLVERGWIETVVHQVNDKQADGRSPGEPKNKLYKNQPIVKKNNSSSSPDFPGSRFISGKYAREIKR